MKRMKWVLPLLVALFSACSQKTSPKMLILYYSQTAGTETVAQQIKAFLPEADIEKITPAVPYDGTYAETIARSGKEREEGILPELNPIEANLSQYDVIFLGYPIWFGTCAPPMLSFLNQANLGGKKIVPFCTFGSGGLSTSVADIVKLQPEAEVLHGYGVRAARLDAVPREVERFLISQGFMEGEAVEEVPFGETAPVTQEDSDIFDAAVGDYPMINARAVTVASRPVPEGTEFLFTAENLPREGMPAMGPSEMKVYVLCEEGKQPVFTQVVR